MGWMTITHAEWLELMAYRATGLTPAEIQERVDFPYTADDEPEPEGEMPDFWAGMDDLHES